MSKTCINRNAVSVCMAAFNGEKFIILQIKSILQQFEYDDELIIIDDGSTDATVEIISSFKDQRIKSFENKINIGQVRTFESCIEKCKHDIILFADQDDIWEASRLNRLCGELLISNVDLVCSNMTLIDDNGAKLDHLRLPALSNADSNRKIKNLMRIFQGKMGYFGCTMVFRKSLLELTLPLPRHIESHDLWFAMCANLLGSISHLEVTTLKHRIHGNNTSLLKRSIFKKIFSRLILLMQLIIAIVRIKNLKS